MKNINILQVNWSDFHTELEFVRRTVFCQEQHVTEEEEMDGLDPNCVHFAASLPDGKIIGCCRMRGNKMERLAVLSEHRKSGAGRLLVDSALKFAATAGYSEVNIHAQTSVVEFYKKSGFKPHGEEFYEARIPHYHMTAKLTE
ncbi:GNAT family N-acetyltransferase [Myxococcota bacterium]|nr:GNAT family N-acetyltransferase [Myxococcota bacterium]MBU1381831.1 GNAT family N-acetyltransferase [Myxococcota bacterium]MBU1498864.1 GNAT family N-acetyltransferase [Myxococcota bacterium]